jgi:DNA polymerase-3 subunit delta'
LQRSLQRGRLAHAYLLTGPRGVGKEPLARTLAKALNCEQQAATGRSSARELPDCCDQCDSCRRIDHGSHPDIHWVRPESKSRRILIEQIREFESAVSLKPTMARVKVGVIVDADCLNESASNAFLKTLEEPPAQTIILLLSTEPQRLLTTIVSRCLKLSLAGGGEGIESPYRQQVLPLLAQHQARGTDRVRGTYALLAGLTGLLNEIRDTTRARVEAADDWEKYPELDAKVRDRLEEQREARIEGEYRAARELVLEDLYSWFADVALARHGAGRELFRNTAYADAIAQRAQAVEPAQTLAHLEAVEDIRDALRRNISEPLALEVGLLKLSA